MLISSFFKYFVIYDILFLRNSLIWGSGQKQKAFLEELEQE